MYFHASRIRLRRLTLFQTILWRLWTLLMRFVKPKGLRRVSLRTDNGFNWILEEWDSKKAMITFRRGGGHQHMAKKVRAFVAIMESRPIHTVDRPDWETVRHVFDSSPRHAADGQIDHVQEV
ncbi:hypothetical protein DUZ99_17810 [Xylanibacillus composti]|uniref:Uncharacterized protein n=1 Tax=Xylanibacillus composti TaxID=1572762 RepID=A0A8J4H1B3_9BACL|nr:hypothetical protein [Xylanibacillus composti]MDT9726837.1 hypothetical protein [Xylanibacillus composti]GIQ67179.1 hypothetical protein XYCOK13_00030 [Xylanibacillus composti]